MPRLYFRNPFDILIHYYLEKQPKADHSEMRKKKTDVGCRISAAESKIGKSNKQSSSKENRQQRRSTTHLFYLCLVDQRLSPARPDYITTLCQNKSSGTRALKFTVNTATVKVRHQNVKTQASSWKGQPIHGNFRIHSLPKQYSNKVCRESSVIENKFICHTRVH